MPSMASGTHVFVPMQDNPPQVNDEDEDDDQLIPWEKSPSPPTPEVSEEDEVSN